MEVSTMKKILQNTEQQRDDFISNYNKSVKYYKNKNDITDRNNGESATKKEAKDKPLRKADNRVSSNFHQLLVDQEAGYLATNAPQIDVHDEDLNSKIKECLGEVFATRLNQLVVDAANAGKGWLHYWYDTDNKFQYGIVPPDQVTPIYTSDLNSKLSAVVRTYSQLNQNDGDYYITVEYWDDKQCTVFTSNNGSSTDWNDLTNDNSAFDVFDVATGDSNGTTNVYNHNFGAIPFIEFDKNKNNQPELQKYKGHIDIYDKVYNEFINDLDDFQQSVITLKGYGGASLDEFMKTLNKDKAIKLDEDGDVGQLQIEIPTQARDDAMQAARDNIFIDGQGIDPKNFNAKSATSGAAIKMFYSHLELKASTTQQYFSLAVNKLIRAILRYLNCPIADTIDISQTWTRTQINNTLEQAQTLAQVAQFSSKEAIAKANPIVTDWQSELQAQKNEQVDDPYSNNSGGK